MHIFTTNWYLYKTHLHPMSAKPQKQNNKTEPKSYAQRKREATHIPKNKAKKKQTKFEDILLEAIDEGLSVLGESPKEAVYFYLEKTFKMNRSKIPHRIEEFTYAIEKIFGSGAKILEIQIMKCLFKKVGYRFEQCQKQKSLEFIDYVAAIKLEKENRENDNKSKLN